MAVAFIAKYLFESHLYLSTLFQSKLRRITTGGAPRLASGGWIVPDRQGEVSTQHNPSAESENATIGEVKYSPQARRAKNKHKVAKFAWTTQHLTALANIQSKLICVKSIALLQQLSQPLFLTVYTTVLIKHASCISFPVVFQKYSFSGGNIYRGWNTDNKYFYIKNMKLYFCSSKRVWFLKFVSTYMCVCVPLHMMSLFTVSQVN